MNMSTQNRQTGILDINKVRRGGATHKTNKKETSRQKDNSCCGELKGTR